jgi:xanthine dehydrogenase YagS FAD-binding subunit
MNREHALFEVSRCVAITPSDTAPAFVALEAVMLVKRGQNTLEIPASDFFIGPAIDITRMTMLEPGDILLAIRVPGKWAGAHQYYEKVAERRSWDFALGSIAMAARIEGGKIVDVSMVCGAVQCTPRRLTDVESLIRGEAPGEELELLVKRVASRGAQALNFNQFKIPLMQNLAMRAVRTLA